MRRHLVATGGKKPGLIGGAAGSAAVGGAPGSYMPFGAKEMNDFECRRMGQGVSTAMDMRLERGLNMPAEIKLKVWRRCGHFL